MSSVLAAAAEQIAVVMIREAFAHLPAERSAGALAMARTGPLERMLRAITVEAYAEGRKCGVRQGRTELQQEMENDWRPISERVRASAGTPSQEDMVRHRNDAGAGRNDHQGGPVPAW